MNYSKVAQNYNIILHEINDSIILRDGIECHKNYSSITGNNEVFLGYYEDGELKEISFWHELGHAYCFRKMKTHNSSELSDKWPFLKELLHPSEPLAWKYGLRLARVHGRPVFSLKAINWAREQLETYMEDSGDRVNVYGKMKEETKLKIRELSNLYSLK